MPPNKAVAVKLPPSEVIMNRLDRALRPHQVPNANNQLRAGDYVEMLKEMLIPGQELHPTIKRLEKIAERSRVANRILAPALVQLRQDHQEFVR